MIHRRHFLRGAALAGAAGYLGVSPPRAGADAPPETTRIKVVQFPGICLAPQYVAEGLLRAEGFTDVRYVPLATGGITDAVASGEVDLSMSYVANFVEAIASGKGIVLVAGVHAGCFELFGTGRIRTIRDLKGRSVAVPRPLAAQHLFVASMASYVGLDPAQDITWVRQPRDESMRLLAEGNVDAYLGFPPDPQELRAKKIGHVIVNSALDRPWSQYFCCLIGVNGEFVRGHPVATKRAIRAILKASSLCASEPQRVAQSLADRGFAQRYDYALQTLNELPSYGRWREYSAEDTVRFYALRLHEAGLITESPQRIIARGTDWRFVDELKQELKG